MQRLNISATQFVVLMIAHVLITAYAIAAMFYGFEPKLAVYGVPSITTLVIVGLVWTFVQYRLSIAHGAWRFVDIVVSLTMPVVVITALLFWANFPIAAQIVGIVASGIGKLAGDYPVVQTPTDYQWTAWWCFVIFTAVDVVRDYTGIGRRFVHIPWAPPVSPIAEARTEPGVVDNRIVIRHSFEHYIYDAPNRRDIPIPSATRVVERIAAPAAGG
jgi:hypothetical protein